MLTLAGAEEPADGEAVALPGDCHRKDAEFRMPSTSKRAQYGFSPVSAAVPSGAMRLTVNAERDRRISSAARAWR